MEPANTCFAKVSRCFSLAGLAGWYPYPGINKGWAMLKMILQIYIFAASKKI